MELENELLKQIIETFAKYVRAKRAEAARRCRRMEKLLKCIEDRGKIKSSDDGQ